MKKRTVNSILTLLLLVSVAAGLCFGSAPLSLSAVWEVLTGAGDSTTAIILWQLRLPRAAAGILAGVGLSTAGVLLQTVTANDLAGPNIIGINSGAGLAVIWTLTVMPAAGKLLPFAAFLGAFGASMVILLAADRLGSARTGVLLIGIAGCFLIHEVPDRRAENRHSLAFAASFHVKQ